MNKVDLVIWTKNGDRTLGSVLHRINQVIPKEIVNQKILVNDHSCDGTPVVAYQYGWKQIINEGYGISDGANTALKNVETDYFCSFEQDVILAANWWIKISPLILGKNKVAAASGLRFLPKHNFCASIEPYTLTRYGKENIVNYGKTLDNTIWNTSTLRNLGGFPKLNHAGIDTYLHCLFNSKGYKWLVDYNVQSLHIHNGLFNELHHNYFYGQSLPELYNKMSSFSTFGSEASSKYYLKKSLVSPIAGLKMAKRMRDSRLILAYPMVRFAWTLGYLKGLKNGGNY
jgi:glycosyltransferase involved in cell wall biosynthesis